MTKLEEIFEYKKEELEGRLRVRSLADVKSAARDAEPVRGFARALKLSPHPVSLIAEVKKASPSAGLIRADFDPVMIAREYFEAGAECLSVLTDDRYFQGSAENLLKCRAAVPLPILRKDFTADEYHVYEARAMGADAILLIVSHLSFRQVQEYQALAHELGMDALVEVHSLEEADIALELNAPLVGVNNRDLKNMTTELAVSDRVIPRLVKDSLNVCESGLNSHEDVLRAQKAGARSVLIGTVFCRADQPGKEVRRVMRW